MRFEPMTIAWHPGPGRIAGEADRVSAGYAAITYGRDFLERLLGDVAVTRPSGSIENIASPSITHLVAYARALLSATECEDGMALEMLASLAYLEAARGARALHERRSPRFGQARHRQGNRHHRGGIIG
jgi:hypothetical protein